MVSTAGLCAALLLQAADPEETLRLLSYNIRMWEPGVDRLAALIRASGAEIVALNEAWDEARNEELARALGWRIAYGGRGLAGTQPRRPHSINGHYMPQAILTKLEIVASRSFNALEAKKDPSRPDVDPAVPIYRGGTLAVLKTPRGRRIAVFACHLNPWGLKMADDRLKEIQGILDLLQPHAEGPVVVMGDFNTRSHLDGFRGWKVSEWMETRGFDDLFRKVHPDPAAAPGTTNKEDGRIDYIFMNRHLRAVDGRVVEKGVFGSRGFDDSDHLAVFGVLAVRGLK